VWIVYREGSAVGPGALRLTPTRQQEIERLFRDHGKGIGGYVFARVGDAELAEEITARVFLQVVRAYAQLRGPPLPWLWSIVRTELARHFRRPMTSRPLDESLQDTKLLPGDEAERSESSALLAMALKRLEESDRELVGMKFFLRMKNNDIAAAMGLTASNVGVRLFRAIQQLRGLMSQAVCKGESH
jgi:RNA polymerase sigma-70 factor, ECF subfamily